MRLNDDTPEIIEDSALAAAASDASADVVDAANDDAADKADDAVVTDAAPETYDTTAWSMPEGVEFDSEGFEAIEPVLRELNLPQEKAGLLMSAYAEKIVPMIQQRTIEQFDNSAAELKANLARDLLADPEVGGKKIDESKAMAAKAIAHAIPKAEERSEFSTFLNESGLGNHPLLMRLVAGYGRALSEATTLAAAASTTEVSTAQKFYGKKG